MRLHQMRIPSYFKSASNSHFTSHYTFYHFMAHKNSHGITRSYTQKWKSTPCLLAGLEPPFNSINESPDRPSITISATSAKGPGLLIRKTSYMETNTRLAPNRKYANSRTMCLPAGIDDLESKTMCRRCTQQFNSRSLLHSHL